MSTLFTTCIFSGDYLIVKPNYFVSKILEFLQYLDTYFNPKVGGEGGSERSRYEIFSMVNEVSLHIAFHYHLPDMTETLMERT